MGDTVEFDCEWLESLDSVQKKVLGKGANGDVWLVPNRNVVVKKFRYAFEFQRECNMLEYIKKEWRYNTSYKPYSSIVKCCEVDSGEVTKAGNKEVIVYDYYLIMDYQPGMVSIDWDVDIDTPRERIVWLYIFKLMCERVFSLHKIHVIHYDVKRQNFLYNKEYVNELLFDLSVPITRDRLEGIQVIIIDFGLSIKTSSTKRLFAKGTPALVHPALLTEKGLRYLDLNRRYIDIWSLGAMLFRFFNGDKGAWVYSSDKRGSPVTEVLPVNIKNLFKTYKQLSPDGYTFWHKDAEFLKYFMTYDPKKPHTLSCDDYLRIVEDEIHACERLLLSETPGSSMGLKDLSYSELVEMGDSVSPDINTYRPVTREILDLILSNFHEEIETQLGVVERIIDFHIHDVPEEWRGSVEQTYHLLKQDLDSDITFIDVLHRPLVIDIRICDFLNSPIFPKSKEELYNEIYTHSRV